MQFSEVTDLQFSRRASISWRLKIASGRFLNYFSAPAREMAALERRAYVAKARSPGSRLTEDEIRELASYMHDVQELPSRRAYFEGRPLEETFQGLMVPLVRKVLDADAGVRSVLNIGLHYAWCDHALATAYPGIQFMGVDFAPNLAEFNGEFARPNFKVRTGYALDLLESGEVRADLVLMSSTAVVIKNQELRRYARAVARSARYFALSEPLYNFPGGAVVDPLTVSLEESRPSYAYAGYNDKPGPLCYTHNFRAILEEAGFDVVHYHAFRPAFTDLRMVQIIGRAPE